MVHGRDVASMIDCDHLSRFDGQWRESSSFGTDLVGGNGANHVNNPGVVAQAVDFLPSAVNSEFAIGLD